jgi:Mg-chelatase subunit ChlD
VEVRKWQVRQGIEPNITNQMKKNHTDITLVLDRSGSMASVADDTIGGVNRFLKDQKSAPGTATISLHQFDDVFETVINGKDIQSTPELSSSTFVPRGNTALLDAIGRAIKDTGARLDNAKPEDKAEKVVFVIVTDGHENASHEYNQANVFEMIEHQKAKYSWEFVFIGANQNAIKTASGIGISGANAMSYAANSVGTQAVFRSTSSNLRKMRSGEKISMSWEAEDKEAQIKAGLNPDLNQP